MRTVVVLEYRTRANARYWAWGLLNATPPGFETVWYTTPGGGPYVVDIDAAALVFDKYVFTYTTRESMVQVDGGGQ